MKAPVVPCLLCVFLGAFCKKLNVIGRAKGVGCSVAGKFNHGHVVVFGKGVSKRLHRFDFLQVSRQKKHSFGVCLVAVNKFSAMKSFDRNRLDHKFSFFSGV